VTLTPVAVLIKVAGAWEAGTTIVLSDTDASSPITIASVAQANLTDGAVLAETSTGVTVGAGLLGARTAGKGIKISKTGNAFTGGTTVTVRVLYTSAAAA
jgi:hypothetical protein